MCIRWNKECTHACTMHTTTLSFFPPLFLPFILFFSVCFCVCLLSPPSILPYCDCLPFQSQYVDFIFPFSLSIYFCISFHICAIPKYVILHCIFLLYKEYYNLKNSPCLFGEAYFQGLFYLDLCFFYFVHPYRTCFLVGCILYILFNYIFNGSLCLVFSSYILTFIV